MFNQVVWRDHKGVSQKYNSWKLVIGTLKMFDFLADFQVPASSFLRRGVGQEPKHETHSGDFL